MGAAAWALMLCNMTAASAAPASVPKEFRGKWTAARGHCAFDKDAPLTLLTIRRSSLVDLETECEFAWPARGSNGIRLGARCRVGGADWSPAVIVFKGLSSDKISVTFLALPTMVDRPQIYYRCGH